MRQRREQERRRLLGLVLDAISRIGPEEVQPFVRSLAVGEPGNKPFAARNLRFAKGDDKPRAIATLRNLLGSRLPRLLHTVLASLLVLGDDSVVPRTLDRLEEDACFDLRLSAPRFEAQPFGPYLDDRTRGPRRGEMILRPLGLKNYPLEILGSTHMEEIPRAAVRRHVPLLPGTKLVLLVVRQPPQHRRFEVTFQVQAIHAAGDLQIDANAPVAGYIDPVQGSIQSRTKLWWNEGVVRVAPVRLFGLPEGTYRLLGFPLIVGRGATSDGRSYSKEVAVTAGQVSRVTFTVSEPKTVFEDLLPGWRDFKMVAREQREDSGVISVPTLQLLPDGTDGRMWLLWDHQGKIRLVQARNVETWGKAETLALPGIRQTRDFFILKATNGVFYVAFVSEVQGKAGIFLSSSSDMRRWSPSRLILGGADGARLAEQKDGTVLLFCRKRGRGELLRSQDPMGGFSPVSESPLPDAIATTPSGSILGVFRVPAPTGHRCHGSGRRSEVQVRPWLDERIAFGDPISILPEAVDCRLPPARTTLLASGSSLLVGWCQDYRVLLSESRDGRTFSRPGGAVPSFGSASQPERVTLAALPDGRTLMAFVTPDTEIYVATR